MGAESDEVGQRGDDGLRLAFVQFRIDDSEDVSEKVGVGTEWILAGVFDDVLDVFIDRGEDVDFGERGLGAFDEPGEKKVRQIDGVFRPFWIPP